MSSSNSAAHEKLQTLVDKVTEMEAVIQKMAKDMDKVNKYFAKTVKEAKKNAKKEKKEKRVTNGQSGFNKPITVSTELEAFLKLGTGEQISRVDATRKITTYIKENGLQDKSNGRYIHADDTLEKLLKTKENPEPLTWFTLQKFLKGHFSPVTATK